MKKIMKLFVYVAAAAMTLASCQKNEIDGPVKKDVHFTINAGIETKTYISDNGDGTYTPSWKNGDEIGIFFNEQLVEDANLGATFSNTNPNGEEASFDGTASVTGSGTFYAFYPATAFNKVYKGGEVRLDLKNAQNPTSTSFDPSCDLLIAKPYDYEVADGQTEVVINDLCFARMMSVLKINLNSEYLSNETVKSVSFEAEGVQLTGAMRFNLSEGKFVGNLTTSGKSTVTAEYSDYPISVAGEKNAVYFVVAPVTIPVGKTLTFTIETENYDISKVVTTPSEKTFLAGNVNVINLNIVKDDCVAKTEDTSDYTGTYAILAKRTKGGYWYMTNDLGTASTKRFTAEETGEALPEDDVALGASKLWQVSKSGEGYTVKSVGANQYITWSSGNSANLGDSGILFTITKTDDGLYNLSYAASDATRYLSLNETSGSDYFALYKVGQRKDLALIPATVGEEPARLTVKAPSQISAEAGNGSFAYELKNPKDGVQLNATTEAAWITSVIVGDEEVTYTVTANESEEAREAVITLTYGDLTETVTISQAGKPAEGSETVEVTIVASELGYSNSADVTDVMNGLLIFAKNTGQNSPKYYGSGTNIRMYDKNTLTVTAPNGGILTSIAFTVTGSYFNLTTAVGTISNKTWTGNTESVTFTNGSDQTRITKIVVTYQKAAGDPEQPGEGGGETPEPEPDPTPDPEPETPVYSSLAELVEAGAPTTTAKKVTVTLTNEEITKIFVTTSGYRNGVFLQVGEKEIEIFSYDVSEDWVVGGTISGTLTNCDWKLYNSIWELCPANWSELTYKAPEGGSTEPEEPEIPSQGESKTATILFGTPNVKINSESVTGTDSQQNTWTITTIGTTSWTQQPTYSQVGSSNKPATSITFTTTLPANASVSNVSAKFGGFGGTAGTVTLKVGDTSIGTGKLNATTDVEVKSTSTASGNVVTVTVTGIAKGVKCYYITVEYKN